MSTTDGLKKRRRWDQGDGDTAEATDTLPPAKIQMTDSNHVDSKDMPESPPENTDAAKHDAKDISKTDSDSNPADTEAIPDDNKKAHASDEYIAPPMDGSEEKGAGKDSDAGDDQGTGEHKPATDSFTEDVDINLAVNRQLLAKSATQKTIMEETGAEVSTKGRYYLNPDEATPEDPALHLHVEAPTQEVLDRAVAKIKSMRDMSELSAPTPHPTGPHRPFQDKVYVEIDSERGFNVRAKLIGTGGENMKYIQNTTGARVQVRGRGSGFIEGTSGSEAFEPMHLHISAHSEESLAQAKDYCYSLLDTIREQHKEFKEHGRRHHDGYSSRYNGYHGHGNRQYNSQYPPPPPPPQQQQQQQPVAGLPVRNDPAPPNPYAGIPGYEEYAKYYDQYYQYYGVYPDYSSYYDQNTASAAGAAGTSNTAAAQQQQPIQADAYAQNGYSAYQYGYPPAPSLGPNGQGDAAEQIPQPAPSRAHQKQQPSVDDGDGYHNVPPPSNYSPPRKKERSQDTKVSRF